MLSNVNNTKRGKQMNYKVQLLEAAKQLVNGRYASSSSFHLIGIPTPDQHNKAVAEFTNYWAGVAFNPADSMAKIHPVEVTAVEQIIAQPYADLTPPPDAGYTKAEWQQVALGGYANVLHCGVGDILKCNYDRPVMWQWYDIKFTPDFGKSVGYEYTWSLVLQPKTLECHLVGTGYSAPETYWLEKRFTLKGGTK